MKYLAILFFLVSSSVIKGQSDFMEEFTFNTMQHFVESDTGYIRLNVYEDSESKFIFTKDSVSWTYGGTTTVFDVDMHIIQWKFRFFQTSDYDQELDLRQLFYYIKDPNKVVMALEMPDGHKFLFWFYND